MRRDDWCWLAIKVAGLWLVLDGVRSLPDFLGAALQGRGLHDTSLMRPFLAAGVPLAIGLFALLAKHAFGIVPTTPAATDASPPPGAAMRREDWLWVGCKLVGAWLLGISLMQLPMFFAFGERARELVPLSLGMLLPAGFALWLLFGNTLWRLACRPQAHEP